MKKKQEPKDLEKERGKFTMLKGHINVRDKRVT